MKKLYVQAGFVLMCCLFMRGVVASPLLVSVNPGQMVGTVDVSLTNTGPETVSVLLWDTPFENTLSSNVFVIEKSVKDFPFTQTSKYTGRSVKRSAPAAEHYQTIVPGEFIVASVSLNDYYDITEFGEYSIRVAGEIRYEIKSKLQARTKNSVSAVNRLNHAQVLTESVTVRLVPSLAPRLRPPSYDNCSVQEQIDIVDAAQIAESLTDTALRDLQGLPATDRISSPRYNAWFGAYSESRFNQVVSNFTKIDRALKDETLQFDCGCTEAGIFAFVYPAFPYSITLCPSFRSAGANGQDSRAGTLIHELSHFTVLAGTDDHVYGQEGARALAISNPDLVVSNADSYEYFSENAPAVAISLSGAVNVPRVYPSLQLGVQSQGAVAEGQVLTFQVNNANRFELTSVSGDADLYVYRDDQLSDEICQSADSTSATDLCETFVNGTLYIQVRGFTDASFGLTAIGETRVADDDSIELTLGVTVTGLVGANSRDIFQVSGGDIVELESLSGDADLYVFSGPDLMAESLVCSSTATPQQSGTDRCIIPSNQATYFVTVVGYTAADYTLLARSTVASNIVRLEADQTVSGSVIAGSFNYYIVSGVESVVLTSVTGDADLHVTTDSEFQANDTSCTSVEFSSESITDSCAVTNGRDRYILVRGDTDATYTLIGNAGNTEPTGDDPDAPPAIVRSSGGGASGRFGLVVLLTFLGFRVKAKE